ncbi:MAG: FtsX-like permease family protein [Cellulosilyticum sp.]|nr:FtsX-like permease family protein [Cellulosilyticum sp.]
MWIIYKYTIKSIMEKKLRTLLIILAISLAGALYIVSSELSDHIARIYETQNKQSIGEVDVVIKPDEHSPSNTINDGLCRNVSGIYQKVPTFYGVGKYKNAKNQEDVWNLVGYNLEDYKVVNTLQLIESRQEEVFAGNQIIISKKTAQKYDLNLGDKIDLKIEKVRRRLQIVGIAEAKGVFANESSGLYGLLPLDTLSQYYSADGKPNRLYIKGAEESNNVQLLDDLKETYPRYKVEEAFNKEAFNMQMSWMTQPFLLMTAIVVFISGFIIFSTFKVIMLEKMPVVGTFRSIGASQKVMIGVLLVETLCYGIIGGLVGMVVGSNLIKFIVAGLVKGAIGDTGGVKLQTLASGFTLSVVVALISTLIPIMSVAKISLKDIILGNGKKEIKGELKGAIIGTLFIMGGLGISQVDDVRYNVMTSIGGMFLMIYGIIRILPLLVNHFSVFIGYLFRRIFGNIGRLSAKNLKDNKSVLNSITLMTLGISVILIISTVSDNLNEQVIKAYDNIYACDIEVKMKDMDLQKIRAIRNVEGVQGCTKSMIKQEIECDETGSINLSLLAIEDLDFIEYMDLNLQQEEDILLEGLQEGRNIIISEILARKYKFQIGDTLTFHFDNKERVYTIIGTMDNIWNNGFMCVVPMKYYKQDAKESYYSISYVSIKDGIGEEEVVENIKERFKEEAVEVSTVNQMCKENAESNASLMQMISVFGILTLVIGMIGVINNLLISFIERRKGLAVLRSIGMSKRQMLQMIFIEALGSGIIGGLGGMLAGYLLLIVLGDVLFALNLPITIEYIPKLFVIYFIGGSLITVLASILPARSTPKMNIVEAIKFE